MANPLCHPSEFQRNLISVEEEEAAIRCIREARKNGKTFDRYGGVEVEAYEKEFAAWTGTALATAVSSGTAAVHSALAALELEPGSEVICPPITDVGGISPVLFHLCIPRFADTHPGSFNVSADGIRAVLSPHTAAILVAHIAGEPCDMEAICALARSHGIPVIEDVAQAHGAVFQGRMCGSFGELGAFSLMGGKHHTSGGQGGMVSTSDPDLYVKAKAFADRGKHFSPQGVVNLTAGLNYRMTELEAAIGRVQLRRLPGFLKRRRQLAGRLSEHLRGSRMFSLGWMPKGAVSSYWFLRLHVQLDGTTATKTEIAAALNDNGIPAAPTYTSLVYHQPWFRERRIFGQSGLPWSLRQDLGQEMASIHCPNAEEALRNHLLISFNESLQDSTVDRIADALWDLEERYLQHAYLPAAVQSQ